MATSGVEPAVMVGIDGAFVEIVESLSSERIWEVLIDKIQHPNSYLPVTDVKCRVSDDGLGTYREMTFISSGNIIIENIYADREIFEVKFVVKDDEKEHVNIILTSAETGQRRLEFYARHSVTKERVFWSAPRLLAIGGINKVLEKARQAI